MSRIEVSFLDGFQVPPLPHTRMPLRRTTLCPESDSACRDAGPVMSRVLGRSRQSAPRLEARPTAAASASALRICPVFSRTSEAGMTGGTAPELSACSVSEVAVLSGAHRAPRDTSSPDTHLGEGRAFCWNFRGGSSTQAEVQICPLLLLPRPSPRLQSST